MERWFVSQIRTVQRNGGWPALFLAAGFGFFALLSLIASILGVVDIPQDDEWGYVMETSLGIHSLLLRSNEHRILLTRITFLVDRWLFDMDMVPLLIFNLVLYGTVLWIAYRVFVRSLPMDRRWFGFLALFPFLSDQAADTLLVGMHNYSTLTFLAVVVGCRFMVRGASLRDDLLAGVAWVVAAFSYAGWVPGAVACALLGWVWRWRQGKSRSPLVFLLTGAGVWAWSLGYRKLGYHPEYAWPWELEFWRALAEGVATGFGAPAKPLGLQFAYLAIFLVTMGVAAREAFRKSSVAETRKEWLLLLLPCFGYLLAYALTSFGRAKFGRFAGTGERYFFNLAFAPFFTLLCWAKFFPRPRLVAGVGLVLLAPLLSEHLHFERYKLIHERRLRIKNAAARVSQGERPVPGIGPADYHVHAVRESKRLGFKYAQDW